MCFENIRKILYIAQISFIYCDLLKQTSHNTMFIVHASYQLPYETTGNCRGLCHLTEIGIFLGLRIFPAISRDLSDMFQDVENLMIACDAL